MVGEAKHIALADLRRQIDRMMDRLERDPSFPEDLQLTHDAYWTISPDEAVTMNTEPKLMVGSLSDDLERLDWSLGVVTPMEIEAVASILRYLSRTPSKS